MKKTRILECGGYYMLESLSTSRNCYFENQEEVARFRSLFNRYLGGYVEIDRVYISSEGYQILLRLKSKKAIKTAYKKVCSKRGKEEKLRFLEEPWRIISEQMRVFGSVYAKWINSKRERSGGLVKERYNRYFFETFQEYEAYRMEMDKGKEIQSQENVRYRVSERWKRGINWVLVRGVEWVESLKNKGLQSYVASYLIEFTNIAHSHPPKPPFP